MEKKRKEEIRKVLGMKKSNFGTLKCIFFFLLHFVCSHSSLSSSLFPHENVEGIVFDVTAIAHIIYFFFVCNYTNFR